MMGDAADNGKRFLIPAGDVGDPAPNCVAVEATEAELRRDVTRAARGIVDAVRVPEGSRVVVVFARADGEFVGVAANTSHDDVLAMLDCALNGDDYQDHRSEGT